MIALAWSCNPKALLADEPTTALDALRSGQVDLIETLPPDAIALLKSAGFRIVSNIYPHTWLRRLNFNPSSPFADIRVRTAANLAIDRDSIAVLLEKTGIPAQGWATKDLPWHGKPAFDIRYDPETAKKLLAEAGYGPNKPVELKVFVAASGGGQMLPLPMNETIQTFAGGGHQRHVPDRRFHHDGQHAACGSPPERRRRHQYRHVGAGADLRRRPV